MGGKEGEGIERGGKKRMIEGQTMERYGNVIRSKLR